MFSENSVTHCLVKEQHYNKTTKVTLFSETTTARLFIETTVVATLVSDYLGMVTVVSETILL